MGRSAYIAFVNARDWSGLRGAYRDFALGDRLRGLAEGSADDLDDNATALQEFCCHQDVLEPSAPAIAEALVRLVDDERGAWPMRILLACATAAQPLERDLGFPPPRWPFGGDLPASTPEWFLRKLEYGRRADSTLAVISSGADRLAEAASSPIPEARRLAIRLLATARASARAGDALQRVAIRARDPLERAQSVVALAARGERWDAGTASSLANDENAIVRATIASAQLVTFEGHLSITDATLGLMLQLDTVVDEDQFPWCSGSPSGLLADALTRSGADTARVSHVLLDALHAWSTHPEDFFEIPEGRTAEQIGDRLFHLVFTEHLGRRGFITRADLNELQRSVIDRIEGLNGLLGMGPSSCGIRNLWADRDRLLGRKTGGLDHVVAGVFVGEHRVTWPVWKWWLEAEEYARGAYPGSADGASAVAATADHLRRVLTTRQRDEAIADARAGAYGIDADSLARALEAAVATAPSTPDDVSGGG